MHKIEHPLFSFYTFPLFEDFPELVHFVSSGERTIGFREDEPLLPVANNRILLAEAVGFQAGQWITAQQVHSARITLVGQAECGRGALDKISRIPNTDALVTAEEDVCLMVLSADCVPVLLYDPEKRVAAAIHAGWRGTAAQIVRQTIEFMHEKWGCSPVHIRAGIGPSIGPCCFETGEEVAQVFTALFPDHPEICRPGRKEGKFQVNLWETNRLTLQQAGVLPGHIEVAGMCTVCHPDHFFSYRRDGQAAGRFGAGIMVKR